MADPQEEKREKDNEGLKNKKTTGGAVEEETVVEDPVVEDLFALLSKLKLKEKEEESEPKAGPLPEATFEAIIDLLKNDKVKNVIVMAGAGISVESGIPDFRSPGTGLYDNLQKYNLPSPESVFDIGYFKENPEPFTKLAKELYPGNFKPTAAHYFVSLLAKKKILLRHFTQNIDNLERLASVPQDKLVEAHGSFARAHCIDCHEEHTHDWVKEKIFADQVPRCLKCSGLVKPDITFFGEGLPERFWKCEKEDFPKCDLLIVMGTSLTVQPFASLISNVGDDCPRLLLNREIVGESKGAQMDLLVMLGLAPRGGFRFSDPKNRRDVAHIKDLQEGVMDLVKALGWEDELKELMDAPLGTL